MKSLTASRKSICKVFKVKFVKNIQKVFVKLCNWNDHDKFINYVTGIWEIHFKWVDKPLRTNRSVYYNMRLKRWFYWKDNQNFKRFFKKIHGQKHLMPVVLKLAELFLLMFATNATCEQSYLTMKTFLRNTTTGVT